MLPTPLAIPLQILVINSGNSPTTVAMIVGIASIIPLNSVIAALIIKPTLLTKKDTIEFTKSGNTAHTEAITVGNASAIP